MPQLRYHNNDATKVKEWRTQLSAATMETIAAYKDRLNALFEAGTSFTEAVKAGKDMSRARNRGAEDAEMAMLAEVGRKFPQTLQYVLNIRARNATAALSQDDIGQVIELLEVINNFLTYQYMIRGVVPTYSLIDLWSKDRENYWSSK